MSNETILEVLHSVYAALVIPEQWTKHTSARNALGEKVPVTDQSAVQFCLSGAEHAAEFAVIGYSAPPQLRDAIVTVLTRAMPGRFKRSRTVVGFNDEYKTKHRDIVTLLERAIIKQEKVVRA